MIIIKYRKVITVEINRIIKGYVYFNYILVIYSDWKDCLKHLFLFSTSLYILNLNWF